MKNVRTMAMVDFVRQRKYCSTDELMRAFDVSTATVRRDISAIVRGNHLRKVHGGVAAIETPADLPAPANNDPFTERVQARAEQKAAIGRLAESLVTNEDILFVDSSTTALFLARQLQKSRLPHLTIVTNSVAIIQEFRLFPSQFVLISLGGSFNLQLNAFLGKATIEALGKLKVNRAFISAAGITAHGLFTYHESHAEFLKTVLEAAKEVHVVLDSTKFNKNALFEICSLERVDSLISDLAPSSSITNSLRKLHLTAPL